VRVQELEPPGWIRVARWATGAVSLPSFVAAAGGMPVTGWIWLATLVVFAALFVVRLRHLVQDVEPEELPLEPLTGPA
jgi:hypothetical protein